MKVGESDIERHELYRYYAGTDDQGLRYGARSKPRR